MPHPSALYWKQVKCKLKFYKTHRCAIKHHWRMKGDYRRFQCKISDLYVLAQLNCWIICVMFTLWGNEIFREKLADFPYNMLQRILLPNKSTQTSLAPNGIFATKHVLLNLINIHPCGKRKRHEVYFGNCWAWEIILSVKCFPVWARGPESELQNPHKKKGVRVCREVGPQLPEA